MSGCYILDEKAQKFADRHTESKFAGVVVEATNFFFGGTLKTRTCISFLVIQLLLPASAVAQMPTQEQSKYVTSKDAIQNGVEAVTIREAVVFLFAEDNDDPCANRNAQPIGTGFFVSFSLKKDPSKAFRFIITNSHVLAERQAIIVRLNDLLGKAAVCKKIDLSKGVLYPSDAAVDLAAISIPDIPNTNPKAFDYSYILGREQLKKAELEEGTEVVGVGFLKPYAGLQKNFPVMRFGKIALITEEHWFEEPLKPVGQGYILEIYTVDGSSGSPVVIQPSQVRVNSAGTFQQRRMPPYMIGVIKGHPTIQTPIYKFKNQDIQLIPNTCAAVSSGVAIIEPGDNLKKFMREIGQVFAEKGQPVLLNEAF